MYKKIITTKANTILYLLSKIRQYLNTNQLKTAYQSLVRPILEYCPSLLLSITTQLSLKLERIQNTAIRIILRIPKLTSITSGRLQLNLPTLKSRRLLLFHNFVHFKLLKNKASPYIIHLINNMTTHNKTLRASNGNKHIIKPYYRTNFGKANLPHLVYTALTSKPETKFTS